MENSDPEDPETSTKSHPSSNHQENRQTETASKISSGHAARELTVEELQKLESDTRVLSEFKQEKLEKEAKKNWDLFYKRNTTKFFKDRHWTTREFSELCGSQVGEKDRPTILEVGCGVGNFVFPLLEELPNTFFHACDFSPRAVQFVKDNPLYREDRCHAFQCDLTFDPLTRDVPPSSVDIVTMIFVLSAIHPDKMSHVLGNIASVLKPGGCILFRDYGIHDHAMLRFTPGHKLSNNFYVRQDGTRAFFFSKDSLATMFQESGFEEIANDYLARETVNRKEGLRVPRVFVQGKFRKRHKTSDNTLTEGCKDCESVDDGTAKDTEMTGVSRDDVTTCNQKIDIGVGFTLPCDSIDDKLENLVITDKHS